MKGWSIMIVLVLLALFTCRIYGWCMKWKVPGSLTACIKKDKEDCKTFKSADACKELTLEFKSGKAGGGYQCVIFSKRDCAGLFASVEEDGWAQFPFVPKSFKCPCRKK